MSPQELIKHTAHIFCEDYKGDFPVEDKNRFLKTVVPLIELYFSQFAAWRSQAHYCESSDPTNLFEDAPYIGYLPSYRQHATQNSSFLANPSGSSSNSRFSYRGL